MNSWMLFGSGGHAKSVRDVITNLGDSVFGYVAPPGSQIEGGKILVDDASGIELAGKNGLNAAVCIGDNALRRIIATELIENLPPSRLKPLISKTSTVSTYCVVGNLAQILEHVHVGANANIGIGAIVNTGAIVEHDCYVGSYSHIAPRATLLGSAFVGEGSLIGSGAVVLPGVIVGTNVVVGAGAVVTRDCQDGGVYYGAPARIIGETS